MRIRNSFPIQPPALQQLVVLPRIARSWRLVMLQMNWTYSATVLNRWALLEVLDGAANTLGTFTGGPYGAISVGWTTFASGISTYISQGSYETVGIPDDLWIRPEWTVQMRISQGVASDAITFAAVVREFFDRDGKDDSSPSV